jgi:hypothetical protein
MIDVVHKIKLQPHFRSSGQMGRQAGKDDPPIVKRAGAGAAREGNRKIGGWIRGQGEGRGVEAEVWRISWPAADEKKLIFILAFPRVFPCMQLLYTLLYDYGITVRGAFIQPMSQYQYTRISSITRRVSAERCQPCSQRRRRVPQF